MTPYQYVHNNPVNLIDPTGMSADGWYEDRKGEIKHDKRINSQSDLEKYKIEGEFIDKSFVGVDQNNNQYNFNEDGTVNSRNKNEEFKSGTTVKSVVKQERVLDSKSIKSLPTTELSAAVAISQYDSPAPGPADVFATLAVLYAAVSYFTNEDIEQTISVNYSISNKGFYHAMGQRGNNDKRLEPEELERITAKPAGQRTSAEKQKLKAHEKATQQRGSRHNKGGKKR